MLILNAVAAAAIAGAGAAFDLHSGRIPNRFLAAAFAGVVLIRASGGTGELWGVLLGCVLPVLLLGPLFCFRMLGAGDIKLFCVLGALFGPRGCLACMAWSFVLGAVISVGVMLAYGTFEARLRHLSAYVRTAVQSGQRTAYRCGTFEPGANIHFSVPILMTVILMTGGVI